MKLHLFLLLPLGLFVASCGDNPTAENMEAELEEGANEVAMATDRAGNALENTLDPDDANYFNETIGSVQGVGGDLTAIPPAAAVANIDGWIARLEGRDGTYEIVEGLENLKEALTDDDGIDGQEVGTHLNELAEDIREKNNPMLAPLANALAAGGDKLGGI